MAKKKKRRKRSRIKYSKTFEKFYKENKRKIIEGLEGDLHKSQIKRHFQSSVKEEMYMNPGMSEREALKKVLRSSTFTSAEENFEEYKKTVFDYVFKGIKADVKKYLGMNYRDRLDIANFSKTSEGWKYSYNGKNILFLRNNDTKIEGYVVLYA